jgi:5-methylthioadenosine/S-adenosylhomocysteine deaminase
VDDVIHLPAFNKDSVYAVMKAYRDLGLRARVTANVVNRPWVEFMPFVKEVTPPEVLAKFTSIRYPDAEELVDWCSEVIEETHSDGARVQFILAPSAPDRCTPELLIGISQLARDWNLPMDIHVQENLTNAVSGPLFYGGTHVKHLDNIGVLSEQTVLIHAVWLTDEDIRRLADRGAAVVHNPVSNMKLGAGIAPVRKLLDAGLRVGLGCDGFSCNDSHNMFEAMKMTGLLQNVTTPIYDEWLSPDEVFRMATEGGARAHLMEQVGRIAAGYKADLVLLDLDTPAFRPLNNALHQIVYCENGASVDTVIVDGQVIMEGNLLLSLDEGKIVSEALAWHGLFLERAQTSWQLAAELEPYFRRAYMRCVEFMRELEVSRFGQVI